MAGCYGGSPEDRYYEAMLFRYLESQDELEEDDEISDYQYRQEEAEYAEDLRREEKLLN